MMNKEEKNVMQAARDEILRLRQENTILRSKVETFDALMLLFNTRPAYGSIIETEDVAWKIEKLLSSITGEVK